MDKNKLKTAIKKAIKDNNFSYPIEGIEDIERLFNSLEQYNEIPFSVCETGSGSDYWLQADYYSEKIKHSIILSYDYSSYFEDEEDLITTILETVEGVKKLEDSISINQLEQKGKKQKA